MFFTNGLTATDVDGLIIEGNVFEPAGSVVNLTTCTAVALRNNSYPGGGTVSPAGLPTGGQLAGTATYDPASLVDGAGATTTVTVTGAALGDMAFASFSNNLQGITLTAWVSAANTVSVRFQNESGGTLDLASGTLKAWVLK